MSVSSKKSLSGMYVASELFPSSLNTSSSNPNGLSSKGSGSSYVSSIDKEDALNSRTLHTAMNTLDSYDHEELDTKKKYNMKLTLPKQEEELMKSLNSSPNVDIDSNNSNNNSNNTSNKNNTMNNTMNREYYIDVSPSQENMSNPITLLPTPDLKSHGSRPYSSMNDSLTRNLQISGLLDDVNVAFDTRLSGIHTRIQELTTNYTKLQNVLQVHQSSSISQKQQQERDRSWISRLEGMLNTLDSTCKEHSDRFFVFDDRMSSYDKLNNSRFIQLERAVAEQNMQIGEMTSMLSSIQKDQSILNEERGTVLRVVEGLGQQQNECALDRRQLGLVQADMKGLTGLWVAPLRCEFCSVYNMSSIGSVEEQDGSNASMEGGVLANMLELGIVVHCLKCESLHCHKCAEFVHDSNHSNHGNENDKDDRSSNHSNNDIGKKSRKKQSPLPSKELVPQTWAATLFQHVHTLSKRHHQSLEQIQRARQQIVKERLEAWASLVDTKVAALVRDVKPVLQSQGVQLDKQKTIMQSLKNLHKQVMDVRAFELSTSGALTTEIQDQCTRIKQSEQDKQTPAMTSTAYSKCPHCTQVRNDEPSHKVCAACKHPVNQQVLLASTAISGKLDVAVQKLLTLKHNQLSKRLNPPIPTQPTNDVQYTRQATENTEKIRTILSGSQVLLPPLRK